MFGGHIQTPGNLQLAKIDSAAGGDISVVAAVAGKKVYVFALYLVVGGVTNITFKNGATALTGAMPMLANGSIVLDPTDCPWEQTDAGSTFIINSSAAVQVSGQVTYILI